MIYIKRLRYTAVILFIVLSFRLVAENGHVLTFDDGKAHYIIEAIKHITWPNEDQIHHFNLVLLGGNKNLLTALNNKANSVIRGKSISITQLEELSKADGNIDVVFVSRHKSSLIPEINDKYKNVLIISEGSADKQNLIMVGLLTVRKNIKLSVSRENLIKHGFKVSNGLLGFAGTKADLREQLKDRESSLNKVLDDVKVKENQLRELNTSLKQNKEELLIIQSDLIEQSSLLSDAQTQLNHAQTQLSTLKSNKEAIIIELASNKSSLLEQQNLLLKKETEQTQQQQRLEQLNLNIKEAEKKLNQQVSELQQQSNIIELKEEKITGQRQLLYITIALALIMLLLKVVVLRDSRIRKQANKELAKLNEQLYELATTDDMTTLFNRRHFLELAQRELNQLQRTKSLGAVLMIDIDHFKKINDEHGHAAGDQALIGVANILKENLRSYDIVGRIGGEEFSMFLPNSDIDTATQIAERIREKIADLSTSFQQTSIKLTISIGLTAIKEDENSIDSVINRADKALYQAKSSGRNTVVLL